jgi:aminoglycoside phosphotransferase (APT) family kinase protein
MEPIGTAVSGSWPDVLAAAPGLARRRLRTTLRRAGWGGAPRSGWAGTVAPTVVAAAEPEPGDWLTESITLTDTAVVVAVVRSRSGRRRVVKIPCTTEGAESLRRQAGVLEALRAEPRLAGWAEVTPRPLASGAVDGHRYWVEDAVPGTPVTGTAMRTLRDGPVFAAAVRLIEDLHARTAEASTVDSADISLWVDQPVGRLAAFCAAHPRHRADLPALGRLGARLSEQLTGWRVRTSWIHGDYWAGNLLISGPAVTGVVDWDRAGARQLPLQDLLHLTLFAERARSGCELGEVVVRLLDEDAAADAIGVPAGQLDAWLGGVPPATAVLLFWLRHISLFIDSEGHGDNRDWLRRNVHTVLARC